MGIAQPFLNGFVCSGSQNLQKIHGYSLDTKEIWNTCRSPLGHYYPNPPKPLAYTCQSLAMSITNSIRIYTSRGESDYSQTSKISEVESVSKSSNSEDVKMITPDSCPSFLSSLMSFLSSPSSITQIHQRFRSPSPDHKKEQSHIQVSSSTRMVLTVVSQTGPALKEGILKFFQKGNRRGEDLLPNEDKWEAYWASRQCRLWE